MNSKRSMWKVILGVVGVGLLVTNCTIKTDDDDSNACTAGEKKSGCECPGNAVGYQTCQADGTFDACFCSGVNIGGGSNGGGSGTAGTSSAAGSAGESTSGGASGSAGAGAEGGEAGAAPIVTDPNDCYDCLTKLCAPEWELCTAEDEDNPQDPENAPGDYCLSKEIDGSGQIESVLACVEGERAKGSVNREIVRACGASLGKSADPSFFLWPPDQMTAVTASLVNCMADAPTEIEPGTWADSSNIPTSGSPKPWLDGTCAKLSCTSDQSAK